MCSTRDEISDLINQVLEDLGTETCLSNDDMQYIATYTTGAYDSAVCKIASYLTTSGGVFYEN